MSRQFDRPSGPEGGRGVVATLRDGASRRIANPSWLSRAAGHGLCLSALGFVVALGYAIGTGGQIALMTRPLPMRVALSIPPVVAAFSVGTTLGAALAWRRRYWSLAARIHQTFLALLGLGFTWQLVSLGFLG